MEPLKNVKTTTNDAPTPQPGEQNKNEGQGLNKKISTEDLPANSSHKPDNLSTKASTLNETSVFSRKIEEAKKPYSTPSLNLERTSKIVTDRFKKLADAMQQAELAASDETKNKITEAINNANTTGNIKELNQLWKTAFQNVVENPDNPSAKALIKGLDECQKKEEVLERLKSTINDINLDNDQELRDFFLIDLTAHLMTIGVYIELFREAGISYPKDVDTTDQLYKALKQHDQTKVFDADGKTVNTKNMQGYMLLPLVFGFLSKNESIKKHNIFIPAEIKSEKPLENTCIAAPILSHVKSESHHPEFHIEKKQDMPALDIMEFMVDGLAAGSRPDRFKADAKFSETLPGSQSFWQQRLGMEDGKVPKSWECLLNVNVVSHQVNEVINTLKEKVGHVKLENYFGPARENKQ